MRERGDTIIEVMLAFVVFSMVAVGAIAVMNRGTATAQRTLETTLVRQQIDSQAAALRYIRQEKSDIWGGVVDAASNEEPSQFGKLTEQGRCPNIPDGAIALNARNGTLLGSAPKSMSDESAPLYARVMYNGASATAYGLWIEPIQDDDGFIDFHIRACWDGPGESRPNTLGTIVRIAL